MPEHGSTPSSPTSPTKARRDKRRSRSSRQSSKDFYDASEGDAPTVAPPTAFVPGRRVSAAADKPPLVESTAPVKKEDTIQEKKVDETAPEVDEFGLPVRKTKRTTEDRLTSDDEEHVEVRESEVKQRGSVEDAKESTEVHKSKDEEDEPKTPTRTTSPPPYEAVSPVSVNDSKRSRAGTTGTTGGAPGGGVSEWSHQALAPTKTEEKEEEEEQWQAMSAYDQYDVFDDDGRLVAKGAKESDDEDVYEGLGGAGKGYTRVQIDDDAKSATSMDENTSYLFQGKERGTTVVEEDDEQRDPLQQMAATKTMLTEGQRIAYVGVTRLAIVEILETLERVPSKKATKKELASATESMKKWGQMMMVRLYSHMEIDSSGKSYIEINEQS